MLLCILFLLKKPCKELKQAPNFNELGTTIKKFPEMMEKVVDFFQK